MAMIPVCARCSRFVGASLLLFLILAGGDHSHAQGPSLASLARRGAETKARLARDPAQWEVSVRAARVKYHVRVVTAPPNFEVRILVEPGGAKPLRFARVVSLNGKWYVDELGGVKGVYRPWEAPFSFEIAPLLISEAWPRSYKLKDGHRYEDIDGAGVVLVRMPLDAGQRAQAEGFLRQAKESGVKPNKELAKNMDEIRYRLKHGNIVRVDAASGLGRSATIGTMVLEFGAVEWLKKRPDFPILKDLPDFSAPLPAKRDNLVMIGHFGAWKPGALSRDPGGRLLNLDNGKLLRIPFVGGTCMPGCFVGDRSRVAVSGLDPQGGNLGLYLIDLKTGEQRRLGGKALATGQCHAPILSPDGKSLAVIHHGTDQQWFERRLFLVEIESGEARPLSEAFEGSSFSWLPDGSGLLGIIRQGREKGKAPVSQLVKFSLDGAVKEIRPKIGRYALVVGPKRNRVLFDVQGGFKWFTCDLQGGDLKEVPGDLKGLTDPAVSPDGKRLLMIAHSRPNKAMSPVIVELETGEKTFPDVKPGWWTSPAWR